MNVSVTPGFAAFRLAYEAGRGSLVWRKTVADLETPVAAFLKLAHGGLRLAFDVRKDIVEVMRDAACEQAERVKSLGIVVVVLHRLLNRIMPYQLQLSAFILEERLMHTRLRDAHTGLC